MNAHLHNTIEDAAFRLSVDTWAEFQQAIVCTVIRKESPHRASALRSIIGIKLKMLHSMDKEQARRTMENSRASLNTWLQDKKAVAQKESNRIQSAQDHRDVLTPRP